MTRPEADGYADGAAGKLPRRPDKPRARFHVSRERLRYLVGYYRGADDWTRGGANRAACPVNVLSEIDRGGKVP